MTFEDFIEYLKSNLMTPVKFDTLAGKSYFQAIFHVATSSLEIKNKNGTVGILDKNSLEKSFSGILMLHKRKEMQQATGQ